MKAFILVWLFTMTAQAQVNLEAEYTRLRQEATQLSGRPQDIPQRVEQLKKIYLDSNGRYAFPLVAAHGAKYANNLFSVTQTASQIFSFGILFSNSKELNQLEELNRMTFALTHELEDVNRYVFIDTYTNYFFAKKYGRIAGAEKFIPAMLLQHLNKMLTISVYTPEAKRDLFYQALMNEQHTRVSPMVTRVCGGFSAQWLLPLILKPRVHFAYFPQSVNFQFNDFSSEQERVYYALKSYDIAVQVGWQQVYNALK